MSDSAPPTISKKIPSWISLFAGTFAGVVGVVVGHPLDTIKVKVHSGSGDPNRYGNKANIIKALGTVQLRQ